ncbi:ORF115 [Leucania separata nucleopolyhedrovirus]|uniref:ORF115 n=1 Tax=Leucania separata nucleopolyhedrovirus TaxID=1307956 RepID=Q0IL04_NPVLS|nr:ORF115 [Leucania separata nucleopolyhedrovirus]AAR28879.1 ORF115 [Leucania separata nucleopolyhedrovirus]
MYHLNYLKIYMCAIYKLLILYICFFSSPIISILFPVLYNGISKKKNTTINFYIHTFYLYKNL